MGITSMNDMINPGLSLQIQFLPLGSLLENRTWYSDINSFSWGTDPVMVFQINSSELLVVSDTFGIA